MTGVAGVSGPLTQGLRGGWGVGGVRSVWNGWGVGSQSSSNTKSGGRGEGNDNGYGKAMAKAMAMAMMHAIFCKASPINQGQGLDLLKNDRPNNKITSL